VEFYPVGVGEGVALGCGVHPVGWFKRSLPGNADRLVGMYLRPCGESIWACEFAVGRIGVPRR